MRENETLFSVQYVLGQPVERTECHESQTFPTHTTHVHSLLSQGSAHTACYGGAVAQNMNEHEWMSVNHCLEQDRLWVTRVETAWQLLTERDQMNRSLELGRMSEREAT